MRVATFNICGWKSVVSKGLLNWLNDSKIDILAVQEVKTREVIKPLIDYNYKFFFNPSKFHGVAIITKKEPISVTKQIGHKRFDEEGRFIQLDFEDFILINVYMPQGGREKQDLGYKLEAYGVLIEYISKIKKPIILMGDFNIAHTETDLARPKENKNNTMFTEEERKKIDEIINLGFVDVLRKFYPNNTYTWWLRAFNAKERNIGWRLDYIFVSKVLETSLKDAFVPNLDMSDHCPLIAELSNSD